MDEEEHVMSEIHLGCPPHAKSHFTRFTISPPVLLSSNACTGDFEENPNSICSSNEEAPASQQFIVDKEGDLVLARRKPNQQNVRDVRDSIIIHHHITTVIPNVGLQIWRASLVLADFILHSINTSNYFNDVIALELGAGTGLVGILLARAAHTIFITDKGENILDNCSINVDLNLHTRKYNEKSVRVRQLDWKEPWPPQEIQTENFQTRHSWTSSNIEEAEAASVLVAADVVYSDDFTDAFFGVLHKLMPLGSKKVLFLSLEKRYNFTMEDLDIVAHGYQHFRKFFVEEVPESTTTGYARRQPSLKEAGSASPYFIGKRLDTESIPQYVQEYDRGGDLELWEIRAQAHEST